MYLIVPGTGDGGGNMTLHHAWGLHGWLQFLERCGRRNLAGFVREETKFFFINSVKETLKNVVKRMPPGLQVGTLLLEGLKDGTGQEPEVARDAAEKTIKSGKVAELLLEGKPVVCVHNQAFGQGGTGLGAGPLLTRYFRDELGLMTIPNITTSSVMTHQVNFTQSKYINGVMDEHAEAGISVAHFSTDSIFERDDVTPEEAFAEMDRLQAAMFGPTVRWLSHPSRVDYMDLMRKIYFNPKGSKARSWLISCVPAWGNSSVQIVNQLLNNRYCVFELAEAGGGVLIVEGKLSAKAYAGILSELTARINSVYGGKDGNPNFTIKDVWLPGSETEPNIGLWLGTFNGSIPIKQVPRLDLADRMGAIEIVEDGDKASQPQAEAPASVAVALTAVDVAEQPPAPPPPPDPEMLEFKDKFFSEATRPEEITFAALVRKAESNGETTKQLLQHQEASTVLSLMQAVRTFLEPTDKGYSPSWKELASVFKILGRLQRSGGVHTSWKDALLQAIRNDLGCFKGPKEVANNGASASYKIGDSTPIGLIRTYAAKSGDSFDIARFYEGCYDFLGPEVYKNLWITSSEPVVA